MLRVDSSLNHIPAGRNHVIGLHESINQPLVNIPNFGTAPTAAFVLGTRNDQGAYTVFVYLHQVETRAVVVYVSEPRHLTHEQYRAEEAEALRFVESMGFMVDNLHFPTLAPPEQDTVMGRIPLFRPPQQTLDLYDVQEEPGAPGAPAAAIFGGLSPADSALFQTATPVQGMAATAAPVVGIPASPPVGGIPPMALRHSALPEPAPSGIPAAPAPATASSLTGSLPSGSLGADAAMVAPGFVAAPAGQGPSIAGGVPTGGVPTGGVPTGAHPVPPSLSATPQPPRARDPEALRRLGRFLSTFGWAMALLAGSAGCKSSGVPKPAASVAAQTDLGNQQLGQGRWPDAIKAFEKALDIEEDNFDALRGTGLAYLKLGRLEEAERFYQLSLEANPKSSLARNELAVVFLEQRRCQDSVPLFEKVLEDIFYPTPEFAEHNLAQAYACLGRTDEALNRLDRLVTKRPYFCLGYLTLSQLASKSRRPESTIRACDDFAHYCEQNDKIKNQVLPQQSALCYLRKGLAYAELGDVESARASFERCQSLGEVGRECGKSLELLPR